MDEILKNNYMLDDETSGIILTEINLQSSPERSASSGKYLKKYFHDIRTIKMIKNSLKKSNLTKHDQTQIIQLVKKDLSLNRKIERLLTMQKLFNYCDPFFVSLRRQDLIFKLPAAFPT